MEEIEIKEDEVMAMINSDEKHLHKTISLEFMKEEDFTLHINESYIKESNHE
jgi:hypothetical protein